MDVVNSDWEWSENRAEGVVDWKRCDKAFTKDKSKVCTTYCDENRLYCPRRFIIDDGYVAPA